MKHVIITIDGPSGSGKSTIAKMVAQRLGFPFLDTGALYRTAALAVERSGCSIDDENVCAAVVAQAHIRFSGKKIELNGEDVSSEIRSNHISELASRIASYPSVRKALMNIQRSFSEVSSLVAEGRDTGSVVFPDADVKLYLDASPAARAKRRHDELSAKGQIIRYEDVIRDMEVRDQRDSTRAISPLRVPENAIVVDTTHLDINGVVQKVLGIIENTLSDK
ncbi:MAG: (d)CMP kinase [Desulfomonilia bacterium]